VFAKGDINVFFYRRSTDRHRYGTYRSQCEVPLCEVHCRTRTVKGAQDAQVMFYLSRGAKTFVFTGAVTTGVIWWVCWSESEVSSIGSMNSRSIIACSHAHMLGREEGSSAPLVTAFEPSPIKALYILR